MQSDQVSLWDTRFAGDDFLFGTQPNAFLDSQRARLQQGWKALAIADGEGRNGVWLAEQGLDVLSVDASSVAQQKAKRLAQQRGATLRFELANLESWTFPAGQFDVVAAIFIQFAGPALRARLFDGIKQSLKAGGIVLLEGYGPKQLEYRTGGPPILENLYTEAMLRDAFQGFEVIELRAHDAVVHEGAGHSGMSSLVDLIARKPA
jgi:cyclopropane fatty-acyl-phospholipid synthase-like methyltransferase